MQHDWDNLRFFLTVTRCETVSLSARQLGVNEITVRRRMARLEEDCGQALFERIGGNYKLTAMGRQLAETARNIENFVENAQEYLSGQKALPSGHVRVGAPDGIGTLRIAPALAELQRSLPGLTIELVTLPRQADLARREVDVAIVPNRPNGGGEHRIRSVTPVTLRLYAAKSYLAANAPISSISDLSGHRFIGYPKNAEFLEPLRELSDRMGTTYAVVYSSMNILVQAEATAAGVGLALLPEYVANIHPNLITVLPDSVFAKVPLWLMIHQEMANLPRIRAVTSAMIRSLSEQS